MKRLLPLHFVAIVVALFASGTSAHAAARAYEKLENCHLMPNPANDGDSFHVSHEGKEFIFRTYFVDTPETELEFPERVAEQAKYFGLTLQQTVKIGKIAEEFTHHKLAGKSFTVFTRWDDARGASRLPRYFAHIMVDDNTLAEALVANGLARIFGTPAVMPDGTTAKAFEAHLRELEAKAKSQHLGAWSLRTPATKTNEDWNSFFTAPAKPSPAAAPH